MKPFSGVLEPRCCTRCGQQISWTEHARNQICRPCRMDYLKNVLDDVARETQEIDALEQKRNVLEEQQVLRSIAESYERRNQ